MVRQTTILFLLSAPFSMVRAQITVLTNSVRVVGSLRVRTLISQFHPAALVIAILAHSLRIECQTCVRTLCDSLHFFLLIILLGLKAGSSTPLTPLRQFCTVTFWLTVPGIYTVGLNLLVFHFLIVLTIDLVAWATMFYWLHILQLIVDLFGSITVLGGRSGFFVCQWSSRNHAFMLCCKSGVSLAPRRTQSDKLAKEISASRQLLF